MAEWQTRWTQNPVAARQCGFNSHLRYLQVLKTQGLANREEKLEFATQTFDDGLQKLCNPWRPSLPLDSWVAILLLLTCNRSRPGWQQWFSARLLRSPFPAFEGHFEASPPFILAAGSSCRNRFVRGLSRSGERGDDGLLAVRPRRQMVSCFPDRE